MKWWEKVCEFALTAAIIPIQLYKIIAMSTTPLNAHKRPRTNRRRLEPYQVIWARQMRREGFPRSFVARLLGISVHALHMLVTKATYKDVK